MKAYWDEHHSDAEPRRGQLLQEYSEEIGTPGNIAMAEVIGGLVGKLDTLERINGELIDCVNHLQWWLDRLK